MCAIVLSCHSKWIVRRWGKRRRDKERESESESETGLLPGMFTQTRNFFWRKVQHLDMRERERERERGQVVWWCVDVPENPVSLRHKAAAEADESLSALLLDTHLQTMLLSITWPCRCRTLHADCSEFFSCQLVSPYPASCSVHHSI